VAIVLLFALGHQKLKHFVLLCTFFLQAHCKGAVKDTAGGEVGVKRNSHTPSHTQEFQTGAPATSGWV